MTAISKPGEIFLTKHVVAGYCVQLNKKGVIQVVKVYLNIYLPYVVS